MSKRKKEKYSTSTLLNEMFRGFGNYAYHSKALQKLSPENRDLFLTTYQESLGLTQSNTEAHATRYIKARTDSIASLPGVAFDKNPERLKKLKSLLNSVDHAVQNIGARYHPDNLTSYLGEQRQKAIDFIDQQHQEDIDKIKSTYAADPTQQKNALGTLEAAHQAQRKALEDGITKDVNALHKAVEKEHLRVSTFAVLRHENEHMRKVFDKAYLEGGGNNTGIAMGGEGGIFKDLDFDTLAGYVGNNFKTLTGRNLNVQQTGADPKKTYKFTLDLPNISKFHASIEDLKRLDFSFSSRGYYSDSSNRAMLDMLVIANLLKLSGEENPYADISGYTKNPEMAMKLAQDAFEALRMVGYPEDKIKIIINGKAYTANEKENNFNALFKNNPGRRQEIEQHVSMHQKKADPAMLDAMRKEMETERAKYETPSAAPSSTTGASTSPPAAPVKLSKSGKSKTPPPDGGPGAPPVAVG